MAFEFIARAAARIARSGLVAATATAFAPAATLAGDALRSVQAVDSGGSAAAEAKAPAVQASAVQASTVQVEDNGDQATLTFELSGSIEPTAFVLADPDRVIVDAPRLQFATDPETGKAPEPRRHGRVASRAPTRSLVTAHGLIASFRFGQLEKGRSRLVVDLASPARIVRAKCEARDDGRRLVVELARTDRSHFAAAAQTARSALAPPDQTRNADMRPSGGKPVVMIDPGHGGIDHGATVNGLVEKDLVLDFAKALAAKLETDGRYRPVLTREDDSFIPLNERVRMARDRKVALFVSIHADTLAESAEVSGATVYTASERASDAEAARLAEKENAADAAAGLDRTEDETKVSDILFDLTRRETRAYSHVFAHTLLTYWKVAGRLNKNPQRSAGFRVLKAPDVPSVLLELGYLSNENDEIALLSPEWREKAVARMSDAIAAFFAERDHVSAASDPATGSIPAASLAGTPAAAIANAPGVGAPAHIAGVDRSSR